MSQVVVPDRVSTQLNNWRFLHRLWWFVHYATGLMGILAGALAAAGADASSILLHTWVWGVVAAVATSIVTFLGPLQKARAYHKAFHIVDQACLDYEIEKIEAQQLAELVERARAVSTGADVDTGK